jgi:hypothetical protein
VGGVFLMMPLGYVILMVAALLLVLLSAFDAWLQAGLMPSTATGMSQFVLCFYLATCLVMAAVFAGLGWYFLADARKWVADRERTRHWVTKPRRRPRRRGRRGAPAG